MIKNKIYIVVLITLLWVSGLYLQCYAAIVATTVMSGSLGITVSQLYDSSRKDHKGRIVILDLLPGGPAKLAGLQKGDIITHIDGKATKGRDLKKVVSLLLKGISGTLVELKVYRTYPVRLLNIKVKRVEIEQNKIETIN